MLKCHSNLRPSFLKRTIRTCHRFYSAVPKLTISEEIKQAINDNKPVVSLESTIISHGLPYQANIEMAQSVEGLIRSRGAIPATIGFIKGIPKVGLSTQDLEILADNRDTNAIGKYKVSRRDIPYVMTHGLTGGTTIAATMILSHKAGIDVFATGGLGGVSRPFELMDVSADLDELSKTPVSVVCSGPKSILDIKRTMEYLETKGVPVSTFNDGQFEMDRYPNGKLNVPGFYTRDSGVKSPFTFNNFDDAAKMIYNGKYDMQLENGYVFCIPAPVDVALPDELINGIIDETLVEATEFGITGKDLTPFMLGRINEKTNGVSVKCNVEFVRNNAIAGTKIAIALANLKSGKVSHSINYNT
ncbi:unnamed protein product [Ambrosiozyma monospora]|uniref:Unnamed protein product n=1 Tax=Ambrosiozyma monospora TaxID=43982 RepID=A0ACB5SXZ2_AMBMO|nr:unnamed protein product [Ambrosiozyma monospora]